MSEEGLKGEEGLKDERDRGEWNKPFKTFEDLIKKPLKAPKEEEDEKREREKQEKGPAE